VQRNLVLFRVDGQSLDPQLGARPKDADGDLSAIRRHDFLELPDFHQNSSRACRFPENFSNFTKNKTDTRKINFYSKCNFLAFINT
jgi:hypothetical protein